MNFQMPQKSNHIIINQIIREKVRISSDKDKLKTEKTGYEQIQPQDQFVFRKQFGSDSFFQNSYSMIKEIIQFQLYMIASDKLKKRFRVLVLKEKSSEFRHKDGFGKQERRRV